MKVLKTIEFFLRTKHFPTTYRKLFREISSLYLTSANPGLATIASSPVYCTTNGRRMCFDIKGVVYLIDRERLLIQQHPNDDDISLADDSMKNLRKVLDAMIKNGIPFKMTDTNVTHLGI